MIGLDWLGKLEILNVFYAGFFISNQQGVVVDNLQRGHLASFDDRCKTLVNLKYSESFAKLDKLAHGFYILILKDRIIVFDRCQSKLI